MKYFGIALLASLCLLSACKEEKKTKDIITQKPVIVKKQGPQALESTDNTDAVQWLGKTYTVEIHRRADKEMPLTRDESGSDVDYVFISHGHSDHAGGLRYLLEHNQQARIIVSPDAMSDDYVPFIISISRMGDVHIEKDNHPDEIPDAEQNAQQDTEDEEDGV